MAEATVVQLRRSLQRMLIFWSVLAVVLLVQSAVMLLQLETLASVQREAAQREKLLIDSCRQTLQETTYAGVACADMPVVAAAQ